MAVRLIVFDFDGTLTDIADEGAQFEAAYEAAVAGLLGRDRVAPFRDALVRVRAGAPELGWDMGGGITAPGDADPYISASLAFAELCRAEKLPLLGGDDAKAAALRGEVSGQLYQLAYGALRPAFRPDAAAVLTAALARFEHVRIVTNSSTDKVAKKLRELALPRPLGVAGNARKFEVCEATARGLGIGGVGPVWQVAGLHRPVLPRRGRYFDVLAEVWADTDTTPAQTLVVGDIVELDLVLPGLLGAHVHYVERAHTHAYEAEILRTFGNRATRGGLAGALGGA